MPFDRVWHNATLATLSTSQAMGLVPDGAIAVREGRIAYVGPVDALPRSQAQACPWTDCGGRLITPGLVDCHTHLVHGGNRAAEFEQRLAGASYEDIARAGGGIASTVRATRAADEAVLLAQALPRLDALLAEGVTTIEVKSGYGLEVETEARQLRVARALEQQRRVRVTTSFLGAHALPPDTAVPGEAGKDAYIDLLITRMMPAIAAENLADAVDAFCEGIAFSPVQIRRLFHAAQALGLKVKLHADQLSDLGGAALAAEFGALSADHLEYASVQGAAAMGRAGTVAVLLPGAFYFIRETHRPPVEAFRQHNVPIALATDCNPGTSPLTSVLLTMNMGATLFHLTVHECLAGVTRNAARALGLLEQIGTLDVGKWCDLAIWNVAEPAELVYRMGINPLYQRVWKGE